MATRSPRSIAQSRSPADCGTAAGEFFPFCYGPELPGEQSPDDTHSACFDAAPAEDDLDVVGPTRVTLTLSCDKPKGQICVRLCDVAPDGTSVMITHGVLNLALRDNPEQPTPIVPGEAMNVTLDLDQVAYRLPAGHRLRLAVSTVYWPYIWPTPERATVNLHAGHVDLPVRPNASDGDEWPFEGPEGAAPLAVTVRRVAGMDKTYGRDAKTGETTVTLSMDFGEVENNDHGLISGSRCTQVWTTHPDDPLCASVEISWETTTGRGDWMVRVETKSRMWGDGRRVPYAGEADGLRGRACRLRT